MAIKFDPILKVLGWLGLRQLDVASEIATDTTNFDNILGVTEDTLQKALDVIDDHVIADHSDTSATGTELNTLTDTSNADALHSHTGGLLTGFTDNRIAFGNAAGGLEDDTNLQWDGSILWVYGGILSTGTIQGTILTDGTATISSGNLTTVGRVQAEHLYSTDDLVVDDKATINNVKIGSGSDYLEISSGGDISFSGDAGVDFGEIWTHNSIVNIGLSSAGYTQITSFTENGCSNGSVVPDYTNNHITVGKAGKYMVTISMATSNQAGASHTIDIDFMSNNGAIEYDNLHTYRKLASGTDAGSVSMSGIVELDIDDTVEIWATTDRAQISNVQFTDISMSIHQLSGTTFFDLLKEDGDKILQENGFNIHL